MEQRIWQGQYFVECEYLRFRGGSGSGARIGRVLTDRCDHWPDSRLRRVVATTYLRWAMLCRRDAYWG